MRIGMLLDAVFPPDPRVENEARSLIDAGHEVFLFCLNRTHQQSEECYNGINIRRFPSSWFEYKMSALAYTIPVYTVRMARKIRVFLKKNAIEGIHIHDMQIAGAAFKANRTYQLPVVLDLHENRPEIMKFYPHLQKFPGTVLISPQRWKRKEQEFVTRSDRTIVVTQEAKENLLKRIEIDSENIAVVPNTVLKSFYAESQIQNTVTQKYQDFFVLLYIGDTGLRRGLLTAIHALPQLVKESTSIRLVVAGKSSEDSVLKAAVKRLKMESYVDFLGWVDPSLFPSYISASKLCISPLHRNVHHDTTYANKLFQYMSFGKPLLVSNATAQKKMVISVGSGYVHRASEVNDFVEKALLLYRDENLRTEMGRRGKAFVENEFSWEQTSENLVHLYDNLRT
jgi:glycosyltransferase involved in cell wall biosynthesis